jgi:hypothetical protein
MSVYEVVNGFSWITLTKLKHLYTVLNMIVHLGGRVFLYSLQLRNRVFQSKSYSKSREIYRLQKVENKRMSVYEVVNGFSWITMTKLKHLYTVLNMIVHLGGRVLLYSLQPCKQSFPVKCIF